MKGAVLLTCVCAFFVNAFAEHNLTENLSRTFEITREQAEKCLKKTTVDDMDELDKFIITGRTVVTPSVQRASCTLACSAQEAGLMIGSKMQMDKVHTKINTFNIPIDFKNALHSFTNECNELVKNVTDDCEVVRTVGICMYKKLENHEGRVSLRL